MTQGDTQGAVEVNSEFLLQLAALGPAARDQVVQRGLWALSFAQQLAEAALRHADEDRDAAEVWLSVALDILDDSDDVEDETALVHYAQARLAVQSGDLSQAEQLLLDAQRLWRKTGNSTWLVRSNLGLSQILTMQGRYSDAETAIRNAITWLEQADPSQLSTLQALASAQRNLANVLMFQERHSAALHEYHAAEGYLIAIAGMPESGLDEETLNSELAHIALNRANALTFLDRPIEAEAALLRATELFDAIGDEVNRGRSRTNLGRLYLREGRFAAALEQFDRSALDLIGEMPADAYSDVERLRQADELLLEHASAYLALNLLQEASGALKRCEALFRSSEQPFELARTRYTQGLLRLVGRDYANGRVALQEALSGFESLNNPFWMNRTITALAALEHQEQRTDEAISKLKEIFRETHLGGQANGVLKWDSNSLAEARLLYAQILLEGGKPGAARGVADKLAEEIGLANLKPNEIPRIPHLYLRLEHLRGRAEQLQGNQASARRHLTDALDVMERQRATLPLEDIRTAFLGDKTSVYGDLILSYIDKQAVTESDIENAFDIAERARSRSLLERIRVTVEDDLSSAASTDALDRRDTLRREVHWLYNQMLDEPAKQQDADYLAQLQAKEAALQQYEWRTSPLRTQAEPVKIHEFQRTLGNQQQALVYFAVRDEVIVFLVDKDSVRMFRGLCSYDELAAAQSEFRFQLGRVELGEAYLRRHGTRLRRMADNASKQLYDLLVRPLEEYLSATELRIIPYGSMHLLPFHAFRNETGYLLQQHEIVYAPSASLVVSNQSSTEPFTTQSSFIGVAIDDDDIPAARTEITMASARFADAHLYMDYDASLTNLEQAASDSDILHIATHGLFRPDNSFFSALKLADGWIDVREIYRLPLQAKLVVLSACESGAGEIRGADEVVGLTRGFIGAGANSLVVSLWNVHDKSSAQLMDRFYGHLLSHTSSGRPSAALRAAQLAAIDEEQHPYHWAPFIAVG